MNVRNAPMAVLKALRLHQHPEPRHNLITVQRAKGPTPSQPGPNAQVPTCDTAKG